MGRLGIALLPSILLVCFGFGLEDNSSSDEWKAPPEAKELENPIERTEKSLERGSDLFEENRCFLCHGERGKGDGMIAASLARPPKDLTSEKVQNQTDGELLWKIQEGRPPMPPRKDAMTEEEIWHLVNYLRSLAASNESGSE